MLRTLPSTCLRSIGRKMYHLCFRGFGRTFLARMPDTSRSTMRQGPTNTCQQCMTDTEQYHCCLHSQRMSPYRSRGTFQLRQPPPTTNTYPPHMRCRRLTTLLQPRTSTSQPRSLCTLRCQRQPCTCLPSNLHMCHSLPRILPCIGRRLALIGFLNWLSTPNISRCLNPTCKCLPRREHMPQAAL